LGFFYSCRIYIKYNKIVAKVKVVNNNLDQNLNGTIFNNITSQTIFQFGSFSVTSNFEGRQTIDYTNVLSSFVQPITLDNIGMTDVQSSIIYDNDTNAVLNLDKSNLNTFVRFGSAYELLRISVQNIISSYPGSLFVNSNSIRGGNITFYNFVYDPLINISTFNIPSQFISNVFGLVFNIGNVSTPNDNIINNINLSYNSYVIWSKNDPDNTYNVVGFTGDTAGIPFLTIKVQGNPFIFNSGGTTGYYDYHIKPNNVVFEEYRALLEKYEQYIVSERVDNNGFQFSLNDPTLLDNGSIVYSNATILWTTTDGYNLDINNAAYNKFSTVILTIASKYDAIKTDLIARFLTTSSLKLYDLTQDGKMTKLLRVYGWEFDQLREFIDSLVYINTVTYDKINNIPDQLVSNLSRTFGWDYFSLVNESELVSSFLTIDNNERNLHTDLLPAEVNIELWRRILINTNYFWKAKGTREAIRSIFLLIGIPEPFINITEYVYTVNGKIDPRTVTLSQADFPSNSLPYDTSGYPVAPLETNDFYFQVSGDTDGGQAYMNVFRSVGFVLNQTVDNKKSWIQTGSTTRIDSSTPQYYQEDSRLVLNTKEVDVTLDTAQGIETDVFNYINEIDFPANSSGFTLPYTYINISLGYSISANTFNLPSTPEGDFEVRFNGILLNTPRTGATGSTTYQSDYIINNNSFTINGIAFNKNGNRDVIEATYLFSGGTTSPISGVTVKYITTRIKPNLTGTIVPLPATPSGDVQLTINGIALTKGSNQFIADYIIDPNNPNQIIIQNPDLIAYLATDPYVQVAYINVIGTSSIQARSEVTRIDTFNSSKVYFNNSANKYVYKLNYKINNASEVKFLVDGIALEPNTDYTINTNNPYEVYLPNGLKLGSVISAYYIIGGNDNFNPIIDNSFGVGDINNLSFLEFIDLIQRKLVNATNRKTITDFKGGWYPSLLKVYIDYLKRSTLLDTNPLHSNGYTFDNLYPFLSKYNAFFQRFVDELLSATIILKKSGLLIRNTIFTKQKFTYKRGVYMGLINSPLINNTPTKYILDPQLQYFGNDSSTFYKRPLSQDIMWSDDFVCIGDLCANFVVNNIVISYPITTTTTTLFPFNGVLTITEYTTTQTPILKGNQSGWDGSTNYSFVVSPTILPGYTINIRLQFINSLFITGGTNNQSNSTITIMKNGIKEYSKLNSINHTNNTNIVNNAVIAMKNGDVVNVIIENTALKLSTSPTGIVSSSTEMIPSVTSVTPIGTIPIIVPAIIIHTIPIP